MSYSRLPDAYEVFRDEARAYVVQKFSHILLPLRGPVRDG